VLALALCALTWAGTEAAQAATVSGTVTYGRGTDRNPLQGATVAVTDPLTGLPVAAATTASGGTYALTLADGSYRVAVSAPGMQTRTDSLWVSGDRTYDETLTQDGWARLRLALWREGGGPGRTAVSLGDFGGETDANGTLELWVPDGAYALGLTGGDWSFDGATLALAGDRDLWLDLPARTTLTVRATDLAGGQGLEGATVELPVQEVAASLHVSGTVTGTLRTAAATALTDADGEAVFSVHAGSSPAPISDPGVFGFAMLRPASPRYADTPFATTELTRDQLVELPVERRVEVRGTLSAGTEPLAGAVVNDGSIFLGTTTTGPDGSYTAYVAPSWPSVSFMDPGASPSWHASMQLPASEDAMRDVRLPARRRSWVRAVDGSGEPIATALVNAGRAASVTLDDGTIASISNRFFAAPVAADGMISFPFFDGVEPTSYTVREYAGGPAKPVRRAGALTTAVLGSSAQLVTVAGRLDPDGEPFTDGHVYLGGTPADVRADGWFAVTVTPGEHHLAGSWTAVDGSYGSFSNPAVTVAADQLVEWGWGARTERTVEVVSGLDRPVAGASVYLPPYEDPSSPGDVPDGTTMILRVAGAETGADGKARFRVPGGGAAPMWPDGTVYPPQGDPSPSVSFPAFGANGPASVLVRIGPADVQVPELLCDPPPTGWHDENVSIDCTARDDGSGLANPGDATFTLSTNVPEGEEDARATTGTKEVCDVAGNCATAGPLGPVAVDRAAPAIAFEIVPAPVVSGDWWSVSRVAVQVTATDVSGVSALACSVDGVTRTFAQTRGATTTSGTFYVNQEGRHVAGCTATDGRGRTGSVARDVNLDLKNPAAPLATADRPAEDAVYGWHRDTVTVAFAGNGDPLLADGTAGSGVDPASVPASQTFAVSGTHVASGTVRDRAGRTSATRSLTVKVDADAPSSTLTCPAAPVARGAGATARWADADAHSGLTGTSGGTVALDTSAVGSFTAEHVAADRVGHRTTSSCRYAVVHPFVWRGGIASPPSLNAVAPGVTELPVWFSVGGDRGLGILPPGGVTVRPVACGDGTPTGPASTAALATALTWDAGSGRYRFDWSVARDLQSGDCAALQVTLDDGVERTALFAR
jgi:hypothetical protein